MGKRRSKYINEFVLLGYNTDDVEKTGFLALNKKQKVFTGNLYTITSDIEEALRFPAENLNGSEDFGTPKQWLDFFNSENSLKKWKFHLLKYAVSEGQKKSYKKNLKKKRG